MRFLLLFWLACIAIYGQSRSHSYTATPSAGSVGWFRLLEQSGSNYIDHKAANSLSANGEYVWPLPSAGCMSSDGIGVISFVPCGTNLWSRTGTNTYLTNAGDFVGINTATPIWQFTVESSDYASGEHFPIGARAADGSAAAVLGYRADGATGTAGIVRAGNSKPLDLGTTGAPQALRIQNDGSVSIGSTTDFAELFHVAGAAVIASFLSTYAGVIYLDDDQSNYVLLQAPSVVSSNFDITLPTANCTAGNFLTLTAGVLNCATPSGSISLPAVDTTSIVEGNSDATKEARFEVDTNVPTGTVVVLTVPGANATLAGTNLAQTWTATQVTQHLYPSANNTYDLGENSTPRRWRNIDFAGLFRQNGATLIDASGGANFSSLGVAGVTRIDNAGVGNLASLQIGGTEVLTSARYWTGSLNFEPGTDNSVTLGTTSRRWYSIIASNNLSVYDGSYYRVSASTGGLSLRNSSGTITIALNSSTGSITGESYYVGANLLSNSTRDLTVNSVTWPSSFASVTSAGNATFLSTSVSSLSVASGGSISLNGSEVVSSGRVGKFVSLDINGTANRINSSGVFNGASFNVAGTEVISSGRTGKFVSVDVNGTNFVNSSRDVNAYSLTVNGSYGMSFAGVTLASSYYAAGTVAIDSSRNTNFVNLKATGQLWFPYTDDNSWAIGDGGTNTTAKLAIYDSSGSFIGWVPIFP